MVSFRKSLLLMALLVVVTGIASAQVFNPLSCTANAGVPPPARAEGVAEEIGQVIIVCTGGNPTAQGAAIPTSNIQVILNTNVTSRLLGGTSSEAMLLLDEPAPGIQTVCTVANAPCAITSANGNGTGNYTGGAGRENVFQAVWNTPLQNAPNVLTWNGVPIDPPGTAGNRVIRLVNIRANANGLGVGSTFLPQSINMFINISGTGGLALTNPQLTVAFVVPSMAFTATNAVYNQCEPPVDKFTVRFSENFGTAFRHNTLTTSDVNNQSVPGIIYNTESMFTNEAWPASVRNAGRATQGTRLTARFSGVPSGVTLSIDSITTSSGDSVVRVDTTGTAIALTNGAGSATWEFVTSNPATNGFLQVQFAVGFPATGLPGLGVANVAGNYAPVSTTNIASNTAPVPRFVDNPQSAVSLEINPCQTNLLYPFVTNQAGFDTGLVVSNTSADPFGTAPQQGPCTVYYYGGTAGGGAAPATQVSGTVPAGSQLVFTLSSGGNLGIAATPGFQGYTIIRCNFQYAHGFAFVSDLGAQRLAMGYIPLVMDASKYDQDGNFTRTLVKSEPLNQ